MLLIDLLLVAVLWRMVREGQEARARAQRADADMQSVGERLTGVERQVRLDRLPPFRRPPLL